MGWFGLVVSVGGGCGCIVGDGRRGDEGWLGRKVVRDPVSMLEKGEGRQ